MRYEGYIGIPYAELDCWGLVCRLYREQFGLDLPALDQSVEVADRHEWEPVSRGRELPGDVAVFREGCGHHVGFVVARGKMLHTVSGGASAIERYTGIKWAAKLASIYRHRARLN